MDGGYAKALGVRCTHCHDERDFASDEKRPKRAAREMAAMHWDINQRLQRMENLKSPPDRRQSTAALVTADSKTDRTRPRLDCRTWWRRATIGFVATVTFPAQEV